MSDPEYAAAELKDRLAEHQDALRLASGLLGAPELDRRALLGALGALTIARAGAVGALRQTADALADTGPDSPVGVQAIECLCASFLLTGADSVLERLYGALRSPAAPAAEHGLRLALMTYTEHAERLAERCLALRCELLRD